jgi:hypothetical protein
MSVPSISALTSGHLLQRVDAGLGEEGHEAQPHAVLLLELVLVGVPERHDLGHVHLVVGGQHRGGVLRVLQAPGDGLAQAGHLHPFLALRILGGDRRARGGGGRRAAAAGRGRCRAQHVFLHDAPVAAGALNAGGIEALFGHQLFRRRRVGDVLAAGAGRGRRGRGRRRGARAPPHRRCRRSPRACRPPRRSPLPRRGSGSACRRRAPAPRPRPCRSPARTASRPA